MSNMRDPVILPVEIIDNILEYLNRDESSLPYLFRPQREAVRVRNLHACSLVSRLWYRRSTLKLYSRFQHRGDRDSFTTLWRFLRTVVEKPELGALVQHLDLREWQRKVRLDQVVLNVREERSKRHELRALYDINSRVGYTLQQLSKDMLTEVCEPFAILLIGCLLNVTTFYYSPDLFYLANADCLRHALEKPGMVNRLQNVTVFSSPRGLEWWFKNTDTILFLPALRKLVLIDIVIRWMSDLYSHESSRKSSITDLTIVPGAAGFGSMEAQNWLSDCLEILTPLVSLTLYIPYSPLSPFPDGKLWDLLSAHKHSLQYLDIYRDDTKTMQIIVQQTPSPNRLHEFKKLHTLRIQPRVLSEGIGVIIKSPFPLKDTVPQSLRSLTLYYSAYPDYELERELLDLASDPALLNLDYLILQDPLDMLEINTTNRRIEEMRESLQERFSGGNVLFKLMPIDLLPKGGRNLLKHPVACDPERYVYESHLADKSSLSNEPI